MDSIGQEIINTALQLALVLVIAFVAYLLFGRKTGPFTRYVGLHAPARRSLVWTLSAACVLIPASIGIFLLPSMKEVAAAPNTVAGQLRAHGPTPAAFVLIALVAFVKTALSEEILFRGLVAKRLIARLGFGWGNGVHAALFGALHMVIFVSPKGPAFTWLNAGVFFGVTAGAGWIMAFLNERAGNGSIAPSVLLHGASNALAYPLLAFS